MEIESRNRKRRQAALELDGDDDCVNQQLEEEEEEDDIFPDFTVNNSLWDVWDKIDNHGLVYIHRTSGRPLAISITLDSESSERNGYCFWFQVNLEQVEEISFPLGGTIEIVTFLNSLHSNYERLGSWLCDIVDDRDEMIPNTERDDDVEHILLYYSFLKGVGVSRVEATEEKRKILTVKAVK